MRRFFLWVHVTSRKIVSPSSAVISVNGCNLTDIRLSAQHLPKIGTLDAYDTAIHSGAATHQNNLLIVKQIELAAELTLTVHRQNVGFALGVHIEDFNAAFKHEKEVNAALASVEQPRAFAQPLFNAVIGHTICSINTKPRKG